MISMEGGFRGESNKGDWPKRTTGKRSGKTKMEKSITDEVDHLLHVELDEYPERAEQTGQDDRDGEQEHRQAVLKRSRSLP